MPPAGRHTILGTTEPGGPSRSQSKLDPKDYSQTHNRFPRISKPVELLRHTYDVVVIGSGYGGGVAASRMSRAGQSVCVLERGKERWPGEYPSMLAEAAPEISISGLFAPNDKPGRQVSIGDPTKLYQLVVGEGQNAFVASGLGGTSLLNANVFLEADPGTMSLPEWPEELRKKGALDVYYERAKSMLQPEPYPEDFPPLPKLELLREQAKLLGEESNFKRVPQTTRFENGPNNVGVQMQGSNLTGMDSTGVNDGSKSSTLVNYLSDAWNWGAEIFCECEVRYLKKHPTEEGYLVYFAWHGAKRGMFKDNIHHDLMWIHARKFVFLGAGALGTTEILLRSKALGMRMSDRIGRDMSGNGDILAFGYDTDYEVNGMGKSFPDPYRPIGPTITGVIDCRDQPNPLDGYVIEEGAITQPLVPVLQYMLEAMPGKIYPRNYGLAQWLRHFISRQKSRLSNYAASGSLERTQTYLIMSHDSNQAIMTLENDKTAIRWEGVGRSDHVEFLNGQLAKMTNGVGGTYINSPFYAALGQQEITVHAIGGASISYDETGDNGATDSSGRLFQGNGVSVYDGIVIADGAAVPTALGVNPFATITALAEKFVEDAARRNHLDIDYKTANGVLDLFGRPAHPIPTPKELRHAENLIYNSINSSAEGIEFTEVMSGYINCEDDVKDFQIASDAAQAAGSTARFFLSCHAWNTDSLLDLDAHPAMLTGSFTCAALPGSPFMVLRGDFGLFTKDLRTPDTTNLTYEFDMISTHGEVIHFSGYKLVDRSLAFNPWATWKATSTLYVTLTKAELVIGKGMLNIQIPNFISELATFQSYGSSKLSQWSSTGKFLSFFTEQVFNKFFGSLGSVQWPSTTFIGYKTNKMPPNETIKIKAVDDIVSTLLRWLPNNPAASSPKLLFIPGASVDHQIFALPTIGRNAVEFFQSAGFEVFCVTHRVGKTPNAQRQYTTYDARLDIQAAFKAIHQLQNSVDPIYVIAHCAGSVALSAGLLDGTIPSKWLKGLTASQVFFNPIFGTVNKLKALMPIPMTKLYQMVAGKWFSCISTQHDSLIQRLLNQIVRLYPVGATREICSSVVCHRSELVFGRLWSHKMLNDATHSNLSKFLGGTTMHSLEHLMYMGTHGFVTNNNNENLVTAQNLERLQGLKILFISGSENVVYKPEATDKSFTTLTHKFGQGGYELQVFEGYGHLDCWMGKDADKDIYPTVLRHTTKCMGM
ncbi:cholesterol oxidase [Rhizodiscina lignyota]|uniref:Cholesterol oxidase n=1 Tax=Rhizodiscina lignyota TaxID=1504668 RepID=A0A9P4MAH8_9PEZI|nr:cholesterol oxidase [Rhizodiscina lignyota]